MPAFNFKPQFAPLVESGKKTQTIRRTKRGNVGDTAYLKIGQRTKKCRALGEGILTEVSEISIDESEVGINGVYYFSKTVIDRPFLDKFARADGFSDFLEMKTWFDNQYGLPFSGWLHVWKLKGEVKDVN